MIPLVVEPIALEETFFEAYFDGVHDTYDEFEALLQSPWNPYMWWWISNVALLNQQACGMVLVPLWLGFVIPLVLVFLCDRVGEVAQWMVG